MAVSLERPQKASLACAGGLHSSYNRPLVLGLASEPPSGSFDVGAFSQLGDLAGRRHAWREGGAVLALGPAGGGRGSALSARRAHGRLKETLMVSRWSWRGD